jgi:hypothetical protein
VNARRAAGAEAKSRFKGGIPKVTIEVHDVNLNAEATVNQAQQEVRQRTQ